MGDRSFRDNGSVAARILPQCQGPARPTHKEWRVASQIVRQTASASRGTSTAHILASPDATFADYVALQSGQPAGHKYLETHSIRHCDILRAIRESGAGLQFGSLGLLPIQAWKREPRSWVEHDGEVGTHALGLSLGCRPPLTFVAASGPFTTNGVSVRDLVSRDSQIICTAKYLMAEHHADSIYYVS